MHNRGRLTIRLLLVLVTIAAGGCATKPEMSKEEVANFKGGPMPPGWAASHPMPASGGVKR